MLDRDIEHSAITQTLRGGQPLPPKCPKGIFSGDIIEVAELSQENYDQIIENRIKKKLGDKYDS